MRRADRLFRLVQILRRRRLVTADQLAEELEVSARTVYRDIRDLSLSGVPIRGEAGVGYALPKGFDLPPITLTEDQIEALVLGARTVSSSGDPDLSRAAQELLEKIESVLPEELRRGLATTALFVPEPKLAEEVARHMAPLRRAIRHRRRVRLSYRRADGDRSERTVRPLCLALFSPLWMLAAFCELRKDFRNFRLDRIRGLEVLDSVFEDEPGQGLEDFLRQVVPEQ